MSFTEDLMKQNLANFTKKLSFILEHEKVSQDIKCALLEAITEAENKSEVHTLSPDLIQTAYPLIIGRLGEYGKGIHDSIFRIVESYARSKPWLQNELAQMHIAYSEALNVELEQLAAQISDILKNSLLPKELYNAISGELFIVSAEFRAPEQIFASLKELSKGGAQ